MADYAIPKSGAAYTFFTSLVSQANTKVFQVNPTIAAGDFKVSINGGAFANLTTLPTVTPSGGSTVQISLSASEMTGDNIVVQCVDAAGSEWCDQLIPIQTAPRGIADLAYPATSGRSLAVASGGQVGLNWADVVGQTTTQSLANTTVGTATNLTNAPTNGDLTAAMKASVTAAVPSVTQIRTEMDTNSTQLAAIITAINAQTNLSSLANLYGPAVMEIPSSGSRVFKFTLLIKDQEGKSVNLDATPTITVTNESGTSRAAGLSSVTNVTTGEYTFTYTQSSSASSEQLTFKSAGTVGGENRPAFWVAVVADYDQLSLLNTISANIALVMAKTDNLPASPAAVGSAMTLTSDYNAAKTAASQTSVSAIATILSGITYLKNWLGLAFGKTSDSTTLAEVNATTAGATYNNTTDSLQAIRDQGDAAWITGAGLSGANSVTITVTDGTDPVPGATVRVKAGAATDIQRTDADGVVVFSLDDNTYSVRITAERLSFAPVDLEVTGDVSVSYAMTEVIVDTTAWADGSDLVSYHDAMTIGQMLKDDRTAVDVSDVPTHPIVGRLLSLATGEVNSALSVSNRYTAEALAAMPDSSLETLRWLTCSIAMWHLRQRRVTTDPERQARERKILDDYLDRIRRGELCLDIEANKEAGIGETVPFEQADTQRGTPLLRDRMSGTAGAFPKRRFPKR